MRPRIVCSVRAKIMYTVCFEIFNNRSPDRPCAYLDTDIDHISCLPESARYPRADGGICLRAATDSRNKGIKAFHSADTAMDEHQITGTPLPRENISLQ